MGNLCSKAANKLEPADNFAGPGRRLGDGPNTASSGTKSKQAVPASVTATSPGRTLGEGSNAADASDPRSAAARAAEARAKPATGGKLTAQLNAQKAKSMQQHLTDASKANTGARDADENANNRAWN